MYSVLVIVQLIWALPLCVRGGVTLTTAVHWNDLVSVKPTTYYRRIAVDRHVGQWSTAPPDIFLKKDTVDSRRRNRVDIWYWDYWCQLQVQNGNCTKNLERYYYNARLDQCATFSFSGCSGNKNNFESLVDCERHCKGASKMPVKLPDRATLCSLQPDVGLCVALYDKYYYDVNEATCKEFVYSGCGGNQNRFATPQQCLQKCGNEA